MKEIMNLFHSNNPHYQYLLSAGLRVRPPPYAHA